LNTFLPSAPKGKLTVSIRDSDGNTLSDVKWQLDGREQTSNEVELVTYATYTVSGSEFKGYKNPKSIQVKITTQGTEQQVELVYSKAPDASGGGCDAGYGFIGLLFAGFALRKYLTL
jgi:hypothetical protein